MITFVNFIGQIKSWHSKRLVIVLLLVLNIVVSGCRGDQTEFQDSSWLFSSDCSAPCWANLEPGRTQKNEIVSILLENELIVSDSINIIEGGRQYYDGFIEFSFKDSTIGGTIGIIEDHVSDIAFLRTEKDVRLESLGITLGEIIQETGEPEELFRAEEWIGGNFGEVSHTFVYLINSSQGFAFAYDEDNLPEEKRGEIYADIEINAVFYFFPGDFDKLMEMYFLNLRINDRTEFINWNGYGIYP